MVAFYFSMDCDFNDKAVDISHVMEWKMRQERQQLLGGEERALPILSKTDKAKPKKKKNLTLFNHKNNISTPFSF